MKGETLAIKISEDDDYQATLTEVRASDQKASAVYCQQQKNLHMRFGCKVGIITTTTLTTAITAFTGACKRIQPRFLCGALTWFYVRLYITMGSFQVYEGNVPSVRGAARRALTAHGIPGDRGMACYGLGSRTYIRQRFMHSTLLSSSFIWRLYSSCYFVLCLLLGRSRPIYI